MKQTVRSSVRVCAVAAALSFTLHATTAAAQGPVAKVVPESLRPALQEMKTQLALTEDQTAKAGTLISDRVGRATSAVENFGGISFESVVDLLGAARSIRDEFIPELQSILTPEQKTKLASLPKAHEIYVAVMAGWFAEARTGKLKSRVQLTDAQVPQVRDALLNEFRDAIGVIEGLVKKDTEKSSKSAILDAVVDLRSIQREGKRNVERALTAEQKRALDSYEKESIEKSEKAKR